MSDTPRTDAEEIWANPTTTGDDSFQCVPSSFARQLEEELTAALSRAEEAERDAERYRWLRDRSEPNNPVCTFYLSVGEAYKDVRIKPATVDAAIDAARKPSAAGE